MSKVTQETIESELGQVKWHGHYFAAACPFGHVSHTFSLMVYEDGFICLSCDKKGTLDYLYSVITRTTQPAVVMEQVSTVLTPPWNQWREKYGGYNGLVEKAIENLNDWKFFRRSILKRGISHMTIERARLGYLDGWIIFPCFDEDDVLVDITARHSAQRAFGNRHRTNRDESTHVFCPDWEAVKQSKYVYVPFGLFDCLSLMEIGLPTMTGISGKQIPAELLSLIKIHLILPDYNEEISAVNLQMKLGWRGQIVRLPYEETEKDPNDILLQRGATILKEMLT